MLCFVKIWNSEEKPQFSIIFTHFVIVCLVFNNEKMFKFLGKRGNEKGYNLRDFMSTSNNRDFTHDGENGNVRRRRFPCL